MAGTDKRYPLFAGRFRLLVPAALDKAVFTVDNPYGYVLNIRHARIAPLYERYKKTNRLPPQFPISDEERADFESRVLRYLHVECALARPSALPGEKKRQPV